MKERMKKNKFSHHTFNTVFLSVSAQQPETQLTMLSSGTSLLASAKLLSPGFNTILTSIFVRLLYWLLHLYMTSKYSSRTWGSSLSTFCSGNFRHSNGYEKCLHDKHFQVYISTSTLFWTSDFHILSTGHFHLNVYQIAPS